MPGNNAAPQVSIVVPVYRNAESLPELAARVSKALDDFAPDYELIFVDDGSPDDAWAVIQDLGRADRRVKGLKLSRNFGQHPAIAAGFDTARGEAIVLMDGDLQDQPEELPKLLGRLGDGVDIVYTIKRGGDGTGSRRLTSRLFHAAFQRIARVRVPEDVGTYRAFSRKVLDALRRYPEANVIFGPLMFFIGFRPAYVEVPRAPRAHGATSYSFFARLYLALRSLISYTDLPARMFLWTGLAILCAISLYGALVLLQAVVFGSMLPSGLTLVLLLLIATLAIVLLGFGVIGVYVFQVHQEVLRRPRYLVSESVNISE